MSAGNGSTNTGDDVGVTLLREPEEASTRADSPKRKPAKAKRKPAKPKTKEGKSHVK